MGFLAELTILHSKNKKEAFTIHVHNARLLGGEKFVKFVNVYGIKIVNDGR